MGMLLGGTPTEAEQPAKAAPKREKRPRPKRRGPVAPVFSSPRVKAKGKAKHKRERDACRRKRGRPTKGRFQRKIQRQ